VGALVSGRFGRALLPRVLLSVAWVVGWVGSAGPAWADCIQSGSSVVCSGNSPNGFAAGVSVNGLGVTVQPGATVGTTGSMAITVNDNNTVINQGSISVSGDAVGIYGGSSNTISNQGTIASGDLGGGIAALSSTITNDGRITVGTQGIGIIGIGNIVTNSGAITAGNGGFGIIDLGGGTIANAGTIRAGDLANGIFGRGTVTNTGLIAVGTDSIAIYTGGNIWNAGTLVVGDAVNYAARGLWAEGDNLGITNTGSILGGLGTVGMVAEGSSTIVRNTGLISVGAFGLGMTGQGDNATVLNSGQIIVGGTGGTGMGAVGTSTTLVNDGLIQAGARGRGIGVLGDLANITNNGVINVGDCGVGIDAFVGSGATIRNSGRIAAGNCGGAGSQWAAGAFMGSGDTLINTGTITAGSGPFAYSILGTDHVTVVNSGVLDGRIDLTVGFTGGNTLVNSGLITVSAPLAPGAGAAHAIEGAFTQTATGTLALRVAADPTVGNFDSFSVLSLPGAPGFANLGGTLRAQLQPGLYRSTTTYLDALTFPAATGRFASVESSSIFFNASAVYRARSVDLVLDRIPFNQVPGSGANARAVGNALEAGYSTSLTGPFADFYSRLLQSGAPGTLSQLTGEVATASQGASFATLGQFLGTVFGQAREARGMTIAGANGARMELATACAGDVCDASTAPGKRLTAWAQGFGSAGSIDGNAGTGSSRVDLNSAGGALGVDAQVTPNVIAGVAMGTTAAAFGLADVASSGTARSIVLGLYGGYTRGPLYIDAALAYGYNSFNTTRSINTGAISEVAYGTFDGHQYGGRIEGGWRFAIDQHALTPFAGLTLQALSQSGYGETSQNTATGAPSVLGVTVQGQTTTSVRSVLGLQFDTTIGASDSVVLKPRLRLGWAHEFNTNRSATVALSLLPGAPFQVTGAQPAADSLLIGTGLEIELGRAVRLYGQFDGDVAINARAFSGTGGVKLIW
jgi:outer membrane autotransporter protein